MGAGSLALTGVYNYSGPTAINGGTLQFGNGTAPLSTVSNILNNSTLILANAGSQAYANQISGGGAVVFAGPGNLSLATSQTYTGRTVVQGGTLSAVAVGPTAMQLPFNGTTADSSVNNNNATLFNSPGNTTGFLLGSQALSLNGSNQYAAVPYSSSLNLTGAYTVSLWEEGTLNGGSGGSAASQGGPALFSTRNGGNFDFDLQVNSAGLHADIGNGSSTWLTTAANYSVALGSSWNMITYAVNSSGYSIYVNGVLGTTGTYSGAPPVLFSSTSESASVGSQEAGLASYPTAGTAGYFNGAVSDVEVFNTRPFGLANRRLVQLPHVYFCPPVSHLGHDRGRWGHAESRQRPDGGFALGRGHGYQFRAHHADAYGRRRQFLADLLGRSPGRRRDLVRVQDRRRDVDARRQQRLLGRHHG